MLRGNEEGISFESTGDTDNGKNRDLENSRGYGGYGGYGHQNSVYRGKPKGKTEGKPKGKTEGKPSAAKRGKTDDKTKKPKSV